MISARAKHSHARISAQKARLAADQIRSKSVDQAVNILRFGKTKSSQLMIKVLNSAVANAENNLGADIDDLFVDQVFVDEGSTFKRFRARARGRGNRILKRTCHITVIVADKKRG